MNKQEFYQDLIRDMSSLIADENRFITILSNSSALLFERLDGVNWAGFYLLDNDTLSEAVSGQGCLCAYSCWQRCMRCGDS